MTSLKNLIPVLCIALLPNFSFGNKTMESVQETEELSQSITAMFVAYQFSDAFDLLAIYWPLPKNEIDNLEEKTIVMFNTIADRYGKTIDYMRVRRETIGEIAIRETYIIRCEYNALRLIFTYYSNDDGWFVNAFKWDDSFTDEFRDAE